MELLDLNPEAIPGRISDDKFLEEYVLVDFSEANHEETPGEISEGTTGLPWKNTLEESQNKLGKEPVKEHLKKTMESIS